MHHNRFIDHVGSHEFLQTALNPASVCTESQRQLVRDILKIILEAGFSPMQYFAKDYKKYFYLAELCSLVDVSAVQILSAHHCLLLLELTAASV